MDKFTGNDYMKDSIIVFEMLKVNVINKKISTLEGLVNYIQNSTDGFWNDVWLKFREDLKLERNEYTDYWHYTSELLPEGLQRIANSDIGANRNKKNLNYQMFFNKYCI